jgi:branched-chain amino acid transport system substrate-binding protein
MDPADAEGTITALMWSAALPTPQAQRFVAAYRAKYQKDPSYYAETNYSGAQWIHAAAEHVDGKVEDREGFLRALRAVQLPNAPRGPMRLDEYQNVVQNIYVRKVEVRGGHAQNTVIYTFHNVSQFWTFSPAAFLAQPVYSRDYPPCRYCA